MANRRHWSNNYTPEQYIEAYLLWKNNWRFDQIAQKSALPEKNLKALLNRIDSYMNGKPMNKMTSEIYKETIRGLRNKNGKPAPETKPVSDTSEIEEKFEKAFTVFQQAIVDLVVEMADKRAENIVKAKEKELADQKEKYEQELIKLQTILAQVKDSSIIGMLNRKLHGGGLLKD